MTLYSEFCFPNRTKLRWKKLILYVLGGAIAPIAFSGSAPAVYVAQLKCKIKITCVKQTSLHLHKAPLHNHIEMSSFFK